MLLENPYSSSIETSRVVCVSGPELPVPVLPDGDPPEYAANNDGHRARAHLEIYMSELLRVPLLTIEEEKALFQLCAQGDEKARERLIKSNLRLVVKVAGVYRNLGLPLMDLISEGNIGLIHAIERFDPSRGGRLCTYAIWWIRQRMRLALANQTKTIRIPMHVIPKMSRIRRITRNLTQRLERDPTDDEIAAEAQLPVHKLTHLKCVCSAFFSLDAPAADDGHATLGDILTDASSKHPGDMLSEGNHTDVLHKAIQSLEPREAQIILLRFGLNGMSQMTLREIGVMINVSRERVRQLQNQALKKIKRLMSEHERSRTRMEILQEMDFDERMQKFRTLIASRENRPAKRPKRQTGKATSLP